MNVKEQVSKIVSEIIQVPLCEINPDASFIDDMGVDSLRALEILAAIENNYEITIEPERLKDMTTLNNIIKIAEEYLSAR